MYAEERQQHIVDRARREGRVDVAELAVELAVTGETIRRDLSVLERHGLLRRVHGGAIPVERLGFEPALATRDAVLGAEKDRIAKAALAEVPEEGSILLDAGTTTARLAEILPVDRQLTILTNALPTALSLATRANFTVLFIGGRVRSRTLACVDPWALDALAQSYVDVAFMATNGLSVQRGLTTPDQAEAAVKKAMIAAARRTVLLADHTKLSSDHLARFAELARHRHVHHRLRPRRTHRRRDRVTRAESGAGMIINRSRGLAERTATDAVSHGPGWCAHDHRSHVHRPVTRAESGAGMIVTLTLNPSLDRTIEVPELVRGAMVRASATRLDPGGKGVNVARALAAHKLPTCAVVPRGGPDGRSSPTLLEEEGIDVCAVPVTGHTRSNVSLVEPDGSVTKINEPGGELAADDLERIVAAVLATAVGADWVVASGSLPPGVPDDVLRPARPPAVRARRPVRGGHLRSGARRRAGCRAPRW